jgi:ABC-type thiamin/hydroxymethylpyrimidine transport system permease subunit
MKCKKCSFALSGAIAVGVWYALGVIAEQFFPDALFNLMPQIMLALDLAPIANKGDFMSLFIGLVQVFAMTFIFLRIACSINCRLSCDSKKK